MLKDKVVERFLKYVTYDTQSNEDSQTVPSTSKQIDFAKVLAKELQDIGLSDVSLDNNGYIMATLKSNCDKNIPTVGFIAHMDTSPDMSDENVKPKIIENYSGQNIILNSENNVILSPADFPELLDCIGKSLITTDGTTLLGADDKAGIAEIITAIEYLINHPEIPHGDIKVGFTPDEEVGRGADHFDVEKFNADFAYTVDGGVLGELEYENFNASGAKIKINGQNVHPGTAKNKMVNSIFIASEFINALPKFDVPENTEGYEGFFHLNSINGEVEATTLNYIIRDFDKKSFEQRKKLIQDIVDFLNTKYGNGTVTAEIKDQYYNMKEKINPVKYIVNIAKKAMETVGVTPIITPARGGTDGARLSFMGLPTPNLFTGGYNFHGKYEFIPMESMEKAVEVILQIIKDVVEFK
jgi:tripeptide aminopeptidase